MFSLLLVLLGRQLGSVERGKGAIFSSVTAPLGKGHHLLPVKNPGTIPVPKPSVDSVWRYLFTGIPYPLCQDY